MICFDRGKNRFNLRVAGVSIYNGRVLLHRTEKDDFWALPGGRNEFNEFSEQTLVREMKEEIDEVVEVNRLLWIVENFFEHESKEFHETSFYYLMDFNEDSLVLTKEEFRGIEGDGYLIYKWFDIEDIDEVEVYPTFIKKKLLNLSPEIEHIMVRED
ncbi:NUDIX hydrolase [Vallitalea okinawensis]|uniref:NUDIX hydrolase n=1 Tax=Vallitalea okinawensis TaxID=2078660 RepID=UPI000CFBF0A5|nr:NUDIX hydrolase [Vallitalea okinawensis]